MSQADTAHPTWRRDPNAPILPTQAQYVAADPGRSVWVGASAGTGKTQVLSNRVLGLLLSGMKPERLLCITFTTAAAAEMRNRITKRLAEWATASDPWLMEALTSLTGSTPDQDRMDRARRLFAEVLDTPAGLKIQTIHSFCQSILRRFPVEAGLAPHFEVMDDRTAAERLATARDQVLIDAADPISPVGALVAGIIEVIDEGGFADVLAALIGESARLSNALRRHGGPDGVMTAVAGRMGVSPGLTRDQVLQDATTALDRYADTARAVIPTLLTGKKTDIKTAEALQTYFEQPVDLHPPLFTGLVAGLFTDKGRGGPVKNPTTKDFPGALEHVREVQAVCETYRDLLNKASVLKATDALIRLGAAVLESYRRQKDLNAALDYDDLIVKVRDLLTTDGAIHWVMFKLDQGIDHVLVDEAQDTNPEQWQIIQALTEEFFSGDSARDLVPALGGESALDRTLFVVGDVKQSIYSFQRADPDWFNRMRGYFQTQITTASKVFETVELDKSFRSTATVLGLVDAVFNKADSGRGVIEPGQFLRHETNRVNEAGAATLLPLASPGDRAERDFWDPSTRESLDQPPEQAVAETIAQTIRGWLDQGTFLSSQGRPIRASDILILVRRRTSFVEDLIRSLKALDVPVAGADRMVLANQIVVQDLMALGDFLLLPEDDLTLASVLKGPFFGYDDDDLFRLCHNRGKTLWASLRASSAANDVQSTARLDAWLAATDFVGPYELFSRVLRAAPAGCSSELGSGLSQIYARFGPEARDPVQEFLALALDHERTHTPSLQSFLHWFRSRDGEIKRDLDEGTQNQVRIMTVHGAKGLEAPIVFLPDTAQIPNPPSRQRDKLLWLADPQADLPVWSPRSALDDAVVTELKQSRQARQMEEYRRLLYVALTRAADEVYVMGWEKRQKTPETCWYRAVEDVFSGVPGTLEPLANNHGLTIRGGTPKPSTENEQTPDPVLPKVPEWARRPPSAEPTPSKPLAPSKPSDEDPPVRSPLSGDDGARFQRGKILHKLLEHLPTLPLDQRRKKAEAYLARPVHDLSPEVQATYLAEIFRLLEDPDLAWLFDPKTGRSEVSLSGLMTTMADNEPAVVTGQIDRLIIRDNDVVVVDYKTNRPPPERVEKVATVYIRQLATYRALLKQIFPKASVRCALLWTDTPDLMWIPNEAMGAFVTSDPT